MKSSQAPLMVRGGAAALDAQLQKSIDGAGRTPIKWVKSASSLRGQAAMTLECRGRVGVVGQPALGSH